MSRNEKTLNVDRIIVLRKTCLMISCCTGKTSLGGLGNIDSIVSLYSIKDRNSGTGSKKETNEAMFKASKSSQSVVQLTLQASAEHLQEDGASRSKANPSIQTSDPSSRAHVCSR